MQPLIEIQTMSECLQQPRCTRRGILANMKQALADYDAAIDRNPDDANRLQQPG